MHCHLYTRQRAKIPDSPVKYRTSGNTRYFCDCVYIWNCCKGILTLAFNTKNKCNSNNFTFKILLLHRFDLWKLFIMLQIIALQIHIPLWLGQHYFCQGPPVGLRKFWQLQTLPHDQLLEHDQEEPLFLEWVALRQYSSAFWSATILETQPCCWKGKTQIKVKK